METKYIFMTGGVCSGLGKGMTAASLGRLLKARGYKVTIQKFDPYINQHPGLLNPLQHGEVYVTEDGAEVDLDLGHYERFIDENLSVANSVSAGKIYAEILNSEVNRAFGGNTIQVIPHITDAIKERIYRASQNAQSDIIISEIGGTVGDIESLPFLEAIRQTQQDVGYQNVMYIHVTLMPYLGFAGEMKTKPTQHSVKDLLGLGIKPDALVCRTERPLDEEIRQKLAQFCHIDKSCIIENIDVDCLYEAPLLLEEEKFAEVVCKRLNTTPRIDPPDLDEWRELTAKVKALKNELTIGLVGKYTALPDAYLSTMEAMKHAGVRYDYKINFKLIDAEKITDKNAAKHLSGLKGIIVPGGYGERGIPGLISAVQYAREKKVPFLGIGLGMHCALIEFAQNVMNRPEADTKEHNPEAEMAVIESIHQNRPFDEGAGNPMATKTMLAMRKGAYPCKLTQGTIVHEAYGETLIYERFRHLYKVNNQYRADFTKAGIIESALSADEQNVEGIELPASMHPWFAAVQFHPEFKSRITRPSPLIKAFIGACLK
ncbi:MAG: CTP synthase [Defluviitaleaceae bacterium]|nr:CTP synthase [Defluviitaleaceae bacterium]